MLTGCRYAWDSATVIGLFCGFAGNLLVWAAYNYWKGDKALIPFSMMTRTVVWTSCLFLAVLMGAMMGESFLRLSKGICVLTLAFHSCKLLPAHLLPSRRRRDADNERRVHASQHPRPAFRRCVCRSSRWHSRKIHTLCLRLCHSHIDWLRPLLDFQHSYHHWRMDWLSDPVRCRTRVSEKPFRRVSCTFC